MANSIVVTLGNVEYNVSRSTLRQWLELEETVKKIKKGKSKDKAKAIYSYLSIVLGDSLDFDTVSWNDVANAFGDVIALNTIKYDFPILKAKIKEVSVSWNYEGRDFYIWAHMLAENYGWDIEYISNLDIDDAVAFAQEIAIEEQLNREWEWGLSENSIKWDRKGRGAHQPLDRPDWMQLPYGREKELETTRIPKIMIPVGIIVKGNEPLKS